MLIPFEQAISEEAATKKAEEEGIMVELGRTVQLPMIWKDKNTLVTQWLGISNNGDIKRRIFDLGLYVDEEALLQVIRDKNLVTVLVASKTAERQVSLPPEIYQTIIDSEVGMCIRLITSIEALTFQKLLQSFDYWFGGEVTKLAEMLLNEVMHDEIKVPKYTVGSIIDISRFPGDLFQIQFRFPDDTARFVKIERSKALCRDFFHLYLGDDPFVKEIKEIFGEYLVKLIV